MSTKFEPTGEPYLVKGLLVLSSASVIVDISSKHVEDYEARMWIALAKQ